MMNGYSALECFCRFNDPNLTLTRVLSEKNIMRLYRTYNDELIE